ncbi:IS30 family transposase [Nesterenkonia sp. PF2B19]|uniref:IS30 family transposase n=2 Tax=unclassified Nesterenkonia TaxID=2629769 RepID=UPI003FA5D4E8
MRQQGRSVRAAAIAVGASATSGYTWDREIRGGAGALPAPGGTRAYNRRMRAHQLLAGTDTNPRFLSLAEREKIRDLRALGTSMREIASQLGRPHSTISREIARNSDSAGRYMPYGAQRMAAQRRARPKRAKLIGDSPLRLWVTRKLSLQWSPAQISATLVTEFPDAPEMRVCPETIYQALYLQARGGLKKEVQTALRTGRTRRKPQGQQRRPRSLGQNMIMISDRPAEIEDRSVPGHWEGDLIMGAGNRSAIATLVERQSRYVMLCHLPGDHTAETVAAAVTAQISRLPQHLRGSLTWDQGSEMAQHHRITIEAELPVYFCDPASPWQRGSNENTNGLLRQYFPKGTDLAVHGPEDLEHVAHLLNGRPRKTLQWATPAEKMRDIILTS